MALKLIRIPKEPKPSKQQKSREEYLVACLSEEANDPKFTGWEKNFILSLTVCRGSGATCRLKSGPGNYRFTPVVKIRF